MKIIKESNQSQEELNFSGTNIYVGIDVHKKSWNVTIMIYNQYIKTISMNPSPKELGKYLRKNYPRGNYYSVYEAGFSGTWIHRALLKAGIKNIIVNPADIPTTNKERLTKTDTVDSKKLAKMLSNGSLQAISVPDTKQEAIRGISRMREHFVKTQTSVKNQINALLNREGVEVDPKYKYGRWSHNYINELRKIKFTEEAVKYELEAEIELLIFIRKKLTEILKEIRRIITETEEINKIIKLLLTIPGIGTITAFTLYTELWDIKRFTNKDKLASYVGLSPACHNSGEKERVLGLINRHNARLRNLLIESAWVAIRHDNALTKKYGELLLRSKPQKAIIRIAKKILFRIRTIWINEVPYIKGNLKSPQNRTITHALPEA